MDLRRQAVICGQSINYIARDSKAYAIRFMWSLINPTVALETMPHMRCVVPEFEEYRFREAFYQTYRTVCRVINDWNVEIFAVCVVQGTLGMLFMKNGSWIRNIFLQ